MGRIRSGNPDQGQHGVLSRVRRCKGERQGLEAFYHVGKKKERKKKKKKRKRKKNNKERKRNADFVFLFNLNVKAQSDLDMHRPTKA